MGTGGRPQLASKPLPTGHAAHAQPDESIAQGHPLCALALWPDVRPVADGGTVADDVQGPCQCEVVAFYTFGIRPAIGWKL